MRRSLVRKPKIKSRGNRINILLFLLIGVQVIYFFGFAQFKMTEHMPAFFSGKAPEATLEVRDMHIGRKVIQDSNDRKDEESLKVMQDSIDELRKDTSEALELFKGNMQEMKRYLDKALTGDNYDNQAHPKRKGKILGYIPTPAAPSFESNCTSLNCALKPPAGDYIPKFKRVN